MALCLLSLNTDVNAQPNAAPAAPLTPQQKAALNHVLFRSPQMTAFIARARDAIQRGDLANGLRMLQQILGDPRGAIDPAVGGAAPPDSFAWTDTGLKSQRREVLDIFESLTDEQLQHYERTYGTLAAEALQQAEASGDLTPLQEVVRRCWPTAAGAQAADRLATRLLDQGQPESAAQLWSDLARSRVHRFRVTEAVFEKAAVAYLLAGNTASAEAMLQQLEARFGIRPASLADLDRELRSSAPQADVWQPEWSTPYGGSSHNTMASGTTPWLEPEWSQSLSSAPLFDTVSNWENSLVAREVDCVAASIAPIVVGGQIVVRDFDGVRACDPATGRVVWRYNGTLSLPQLEKKILASGYRTLANQIAEITWAGNPTTGMLSSDGEHVFAIDWVDFAAIAPGTQRPSRGNTGPTIVATNRLVCLPAARIEQSAGSSAGEPVSVEPLWTAGGAPDPSPSDRLAGHLFVGPPMTFGDSVFAIVESIRDKELRLARLDARTGQLQWLQTLGLIEQPMFAASQRFRRTPSCIPAIAGGIAVCPSDAGFLVGVSTVTGELLWMQTYFEMRLPSRFGSTILRDAEDLFVGFHDPPHIEHNRVVYLPRHSDELHCYHLQTGEELWHVPRNDAQYVGAIRDGVIAVIGKSTIRGVSLDDGRTLWKRRVGIPSGRGVLTSSGYLLPLKSGSVAQIDLETGQRRGSLVVPTLLQRQLERTQTATQSSPRTARDIAMARFGLADESLSSEQRPGNLLLHDQQVFSVGPQQITAFPQAGSLLVDLRARRGTTQNVDLFQLACVELLLGYQADGEQTLADLAAGKQHPQRAAARWMLRNQILSELRRGDAVLTAARFRERVRLFESLVDSPFDEQQLLFERIRWEQQHGTQASVLQAVASLPALQLQSFLPQTDDFESVVSSSALSRSLIRNALADSTDATGNPLHDVLTRDLLTALRSDSIADMQRFIDLYGDSAYAARIRNRLADRLILKGEVQAAELTLIPNLHSDDAQQRAVSQILYITLLSQERLDGEAARALRDGLQQNRGVSIASLKSDDLRSPQAVLSPDSRLLQEAAPTFDDFVAAFDRRLETWSAYLDLQPPTRPVRLVAIRRQPYSAANPELVRLWSQTPRQIAGPEETEFSILHSGSYVNGWWRLVDRYAGSERGTIRIPSRPNFANTADYRSIGHFMPVGGQSMLSGVSLLEYRNQSPVWNFPFPPTESAGETLEPGPATPTVCIFQTRKHLIGIDPRQGNVLWRRSDLDLESGVFVSRDAGLIGDDRVVVLFHRDHQSYTRMDALTGAVLNTGRLPLDFRFEQLVFGRKLFHFSEPDINGQRAARVWDPLTETLDLDERTHTRLLRDATANRDELALLDADGRLRVYHMPDVTLIADTQLGVSALDTASSMMFFSDSERFYVNLVRPSRLGTRSAVRHYPVTDSLPARPLEPGLLLAIDRRSGRILWRRDVTHKSLLRLNQCDLPFFIAMSRVQMTRQVGAIPTLDLEVFDRQTGETLGHARDLYSDRFVHYRLDRESGTLELHGLSSRIDLEFHVPSRGILLEQQPL